MPGFTRNGVVTALLAALAALACGGTSPLSVVLVTLDTTRVDHLSCYGYERTTSPSLDRLAEESVRFTRAWSTSSWTLPAHASLFTGLFPSAHGAHHDDGGTEALGGFRVGRLGEEFTTLAEILAERGYRTGAFIGGPWLKSSFGLMQGFEHVHDEVSGLSGLPAKSLTDLALAWLADIDQREPYFLFVNFFDPHLPYDPPGSEGFGRWRETVTDDWWVEAIRSGSIEADSREILVDRYDSEIREMDRHLGRLLDAVRARAGGHRTLIVVTSDHGEAFGEGGRFLHNMWLGEEMTRIPLVVRYPERRWAGQVDDRAVQLVDVLPMVLDALSLPPTAARALADRQDRAFMELYGSDGGRQRFGRRFDRTLRAVVSWPLKLEVSERGPAVLHRLQGLEERPAKSDSAQLAALHAALRDHLRAVGKVGVRAADPDAETRDSLRALGYIE